MTRPEKFTAAQLIEAIKNTGGIKSTIAKNLNCDRDTVDRYIRNMPTVSAAYKAERESILDLSEGVVMMNIQLAAKIQRDGKQMADTSDAKWVLARLGRDRGFGDRTDLGNADGEPLKVVWEHDARSQVQDTGAAPEADADQDHSKEV